MKLAKKVPGGTVIDKLRYKLEKQAYKHSIDQAKSNFRENNLEKAGKDNSKLWEVLNKQCGLKSTSVSEIAIKINGKIITKKADLVKVFSKYYKDEANRLKGLLNYSVNDHKQYLTPKTFTWDLATVTREEVLLIIKKLKNKRSTGFDNISNFIIKQIGDIIAGPVSKIVNDCIRESIFPNKLKIAKIIPIYKKGSHLEVGNYRPISLLPALSKIFEKVINNQLTEFIEDNDIISKTQFGFRKNMSTTNAVELLVQSIQKSKRDKEKSVAIFIDVSKAFDCCNHEIIFSKLASIGLSSKGVDLFRSYFKDRKQVVRIDNDTSDLVDVEIGVGQGTILGPTLFSLYLYDLPNALDCLTIQFADDTTLYLTAPNNAELKVKSDTALNKLYNWMKDNGLTINEAKTKMIQFLGSGLALDLNGIPITKCGENENEKYFNMLGVLLDQRLTWKYHKDKVINKLYKGKYALYRFRKSLNKRSRFLIYHSLINSHLRYGITLWGNFNGPALKKLIIENKKCIRLIAPGKIHTDPIFKSAKILKLVDLHKHEFYLQSWKFFQQKLPESIDTNLERRINNINLRYDTSLLKPRVLHNTDNYQYDINLIKNINTLDPALRHIININKAKKTFKNMLLDKYKPVVTCNLPTCKECVLQTDQI